MEVLGLSMHPNDTHPFIEQNYKPKQLPGLAHFYVGEDPTLPYPYPTWLTILS